MLEIFPEHPSDTYVFTVKMEILLEPTSNKLLVGEMTFGVLTKVDLMDKGIDAVDWNGLWNSGRRAIISVPLLVLTMEALFVVMSKELDEEVVAYKLETNERFDALEKKLDDGMGRLDASMAAMKEELKQLILGRVTQSKTMPETTKSATKVGPYIPPIPHFNDGLRRDYDDIGFPLPNNTLESSSTIGKNHKVSFFEKDWSVKTNARKVNDLNDDQFRHIDGGSTFVHEMRSIGFGREFGEEPQERETHLISEHRMRKLKMSIFKGDDAHGWIYRVERYFEVQVVIRRERLWAAALCLEGEALAWYRCLTLQVLLVGENDEESMEEEMEVEDDDHAHLDVIEVSLNSVMRLPTVKACKGMVVSLPNMQLIEDFLPSELGSTDVILGIKWLQTLGDVNVNWKLLTMTFMGDRGKITLVGDRRLCRSKMSFKAAARYLQMDGEGFWVGLHNLTTKETPRGTNIPKAMTGLLNNYGDVFTMPNTLPRNREHEHAIVLQDEVAPVSVRPYRYSQVQKGEIEKLVCEMLEAGIIQPSVSPFSSLVLLVKKDESWRFCVDCRALNKATVLDKFPIPIIDELLDELHGPGIFSKIDLKSGYHQIRMKSRDIPKTAFQTHEGHYEFLVMPFEYLGHLITKEEVSADPSKISAMVEWPSLKTLKELRGFLGLTGYYRMFVKGYSSIAGPLTNQLKKDSFKWGEDATNAFEALKKAMAELPMLALPDFNRPFVIEADASRYGVGAVLMQDKKPIAFYSQEVFVLTDQKSLKYLLEQRIVPDALSRRAVSTQLGSLSVPLKLLNGENISDEYQLDGRRLLYQGRLVLPRSSPWIPELFNVFHNSVVGRHSGVLKTFKRMASELYWILIMVVVDRLSKYAHFIPMRHPYTAITVATAFLQEIIRLHGIPESIVSYRDKIFLSDFWKELFKLQGTQLKYSTAYHPQTDGQT
uniref:Integrase catalytic domain-containing protein n=1 Tax=Tanacetum cinerariifolium TaxID=118510 RepID=A0A699GH81_TANCI|nr:hypothetical protein [Tanacetum cinerariifolium]